MNNCNFTSCRFNAEGICENEEAREECVDMSRKVLCLDKDKSCEKCKYSDLDYIFDDEIGEEYPLYTCQKGNDVSLDFECEDFEDYKHKPYKEEDTECDKCYKKNECVEKGYLVDCTFGQDTRQHYTKGRRCICLKGCENLMEMKLSEILEFGLFEETKSFLRKAIDQLGDMTFREFYQEEKVFKVDI